ncbi:UbiE/COQ5 family methyltransferase [Purpureocillium lavendulum]|uniref:UbiE/COQ5 family methyltransferase n=1 Tax=Purpureocillium lavendulum TaxID=1247861 RepID=A0AB34FAU4_9HYPO|nr:UbiE/COQ5 family methyltransferase [Purpureocillium lavendulum]
MTIDDDARFWDKSAPSYSKSAVSDEPGYQRTLDRTSSSLRPTHRVLELGCGTGSTALRLADRVHEYLATDISPQMIKIATEKLQSQVPKVSNLEFRTSTAESLAVCNDDTRGKFHIVLGFNYLHLVRDLSGTLNAVHTLLEDDGLLITKTPCVSEMNPLVKLALPVMRAVGMAPYAAVFREAELSARIAKAGFEVVETEMHSSKGNDHRPFIVARKKT